MKLITVLFLMVLTPFVFSQNEWWKSNPDNKKQEPKSVTKAEAVVNDSTEEPEDIQPGDITIIKSPSIDKLIKFKAATIPPNMGPTMSGYRIQLFFDQDRSAVDKARSEVLQIDGDTPTYIQYRAPNYLLLLGDYRSQLEAEKVRASLISNFPEAIVVEDKIHLPKIKEDEVEPEQN